MISYGETQVYEGEALREGKLVYREKHTVKMEDKNVLSSETIYTDPQGKVLATLRNNYSKSINVPEHEMDDVVHKMKFGIRYKNNAPEMYLLENDQEKLKPFQTSGKKLWVGGQGLHYYLVQNMEEVLKNGKLDLKFIIPGKLDSYDFYLKVSKRSGDNVEFDVEIDNWFLRLFAPRLKLFYNIKSRRLIRYTGLSNIQTEKKDMMSVDIKYRYTD
jgi:hypothetical protein